VSAPRRNLELKARDRDPERSLRVCAELGAEDRGTLRQTDTYFEVAAGRLKLREEPGSDAQLIAYQRPDLAGQKESRYWIVAVADPAGLKQALSALLGLQAVVSKARRLFVFEGVRIHLDRVERLGSFIELEGVATGDTDPADFEALLSDLRRSFEIDQSDLVGGSYSDLVASDAGGA
jgi:predicted adenylyl cyclase CyaB